MINEIGCFGLKRPINSDIGHLQIYRIKTKAFCLNTATDMYIYLAKLSEIKLMFGKIKSVAEVELRRAIQRCLIYHTVTASFPKLPPRACFVHWLFSVLLSVCKKCRILFRPVLLSSTRFFEAS